MELLPLLATLAGIAMGVGWFPQVYKIYKTKSAKDISLATLVLYFPSLLIMALYGLSLNDLPIFLSSALGVLAVGAVTIGYLKYHKQ
ncbi:MAG: SemiSWEET family transporter [Candidatus Woesearchaeota archaeon]